MTLKHGILTFRYPKFENFAKELKETGTYSVNLGDFAQTIAIRNALNQLGHSPADRVAVERDELPGYSGPRCALIMNGVFYDHCFPFSPNIVPVFFGFHAAEATIVRWKDYLRQFQPIGCRDDATTLCCLQNGIEAVTTGCLTLTFPTRLKTPQMPRTLVVHGSPADFPTQVLRRMPEALLDDAEFVHHRLPVTEHPLSPRMASSVETIERSILHRYRHRAGLVITSLHHVAAPCMAIGVPVIVCRTAPDPRFSFLETLVPVHTAETLDAIDWHPRPLDLEARKAAMLADLRTRLAAAERRAGAER